MCTVLTVLAGWLLVSCAAGAVWARIGVVLRRRRAGPGRPPRPRP